MNSEYLNVYLNKIQNIIRSVYDRSTNTTSKSNQTGSGSDKITQTIKKINSELNDLTEQIRIDQHSDPKTKSTLRFEKFKEITEVSIELIKFLGELIELNDDAELKKTQEQIAEMTLLLDKYL